MAAATSDGAPSRALRAGDAEVVDSLERRALLLGRVHPGASRRDDGGLGRRHLPRAAHRRGRRAALTLGVFSLTGGGVGLAARVRARAPGAAPRLAATRTTARAPRVGGRARRRAAVLVVWSGPPGPRRAGARVELWGRASATAWRARGAPPRRCPTGCGSRTGHAGRRGVCATSRGIRAGSPDARTARAGGPLPARRGGRFPAGAPAGRQRLAPRAQAAVGACSSRSRRGRARLGARARARCRAAAAHPGPEPVCDQAAPGRRAGDRGRHRGARGRRVPWALVVDARRGWRLTAAAPCYNDAIAMSEIADRYDPAASSLAGTRVWEERGYFHADADSPKKPVLRSSSRRRTSPARSTWATRSTTRSRTS